MENMGIFKREQKRKGRKKPVKKKEDKREENRIKKGEKFFKNEVAFISAECSAPWELKLNSTLCFV